VENLSQIADEILEGRALDWDALESAADPQTQRVLIQFRTIAEIIDVRRRSAKQPPEWWGHLKIEDRLGAGAFGEVFRAWYTWL
jgi:hypothetical protein